jgi:hypothetical protein
MPEHTMRDRRIADGQWQDDEQIADMRAEAEEAGQFEAGLIEVDAMDLVRVLDEIQRRREEDVQDRLLEWAKTPDGARGMYLAWAASLKAQHQALDRHHVRWEVLEPVEQQHHSSMAQAFTSIALGAIGEADDV